MPGIGAGQNSARADPARIFSKDLTINQGDERR